MGVVIIPSVLDVRLVDAPTGVTQEKGRTGFIHLASVVLAFIFVARRIQPSLSLVDREVKSVYPRINRSLLVGHLFFRGRKNPSSCVRASYIEDCLMCCPTNKVVKRDTKKSSSRRVTRRQDY